LELGFQEFPEAMVTALTPPQFENPLDDIHDRFFGDGPTLSFGRITNLTPDAAKEFARHFCDLSFSRLTALSAEVAEMLGKHEGFLGLSGLRELSDVAAESLSEHEGTLNLYGLLSLSEVAARHFVAASKRSDRSVLVLGFQEFPEELVTALTPPPQSDNPLDDITDIFGDYYTLRFPGLTALSDKVAEILGQHKGSFDLPRLTELSDAAAESLSKHEGNLYIKLDNLPASAAKILRDAGHGE
jgi:hypothetical protein